MNGKNITLKELLELRDIEMQLRELAARIVDFEDKHKFAEEMKRSLDKCIAEINDGIHILHKDIYIMKKKNINGHINGDK